MTDTKVSRVWQLWGKLGLNLPNADPRYAAVGVTCAFPARLRPMACRMHDLVHDQLANGGPPKMLRVQDENMRGCLVIKVRESLCSQDRILRLSRLMPIYCKQTRHPPDNGPEFTAAAIMEMAARPEHKSVLHQSRKSSVKWLRRKL